MQEHQEISAERLLTMQESMSYLSDRGVPCRSRNTFYRLVDDFRIPYKNMKPHGKYEVRRFQQGALDRFIKDFTKADNADTALA